MTRLCASVFVRDPQQARGDALRAVELGADMIELRLDALDVLRSEPPEQWKTDAAVTALATLVDDLTVPVLITCRPASEGGAADSDDETRLTLLAAVAHDAQSYVDLEWQTLHHAGGWPWAFLKLSGQRPEATKIILSAHDFRGRPSNLISLFADMSESRADVVKLVWRARSIRDNVEAFELLRDAAKPTIALCLGEDGLLSRVLAKKFGAFLTFASLDDHARTADGQVPLTTMKRLYRWDSIRRSTKVYGVVGCPVNHSLSPHVHNAAFDAAGWDGVYLPMLVQPGYESFKAFMESLLAFEPLHLAGLSITHPHKENALRYLRERGGAIDPIAARTGAVNTLRIEHDDGVMRLSASNTDADALIQTLAGAVGAEEFLRGMRVALLGAGGTARTAVTALAQQGCDISIYNRTAERAQALAAEFGEGGTQVRAVPLAELRESRAGVFVNATNVGMSPLEHASPLDVSMPPLGPETLVFDAIYNPPRTKLLNQAEQAGARAIGGEQMFLLQAAAQFRLWTGQDAPIDLMRETLRAALSSANG